MINPYFLRLRSIHDKRKMLIELLLDIVDVIVSNFRRNTWLEFVHIIKSMLKVFHREYTKAIDSLAKQRNEVISMTQQGVILLKKSPKLIFIALRVNKHTNQYFYC